MTDTVEFRDPVRGVLAVLFVFAMIIAAFWIVRPFLPAAVWAATIVIATWPLMLRVQALLGGRRGLAVSVMSALLLLGLIVPLVLALSAVLAHLDDITGAIRSIVTWSVPPPPEWLARLPMAGPRLAARWADAAAAPPEEISERLTPYSRQIVGWVAGMIGNVGVLLGQFLLVVIFATILYATGETAAEATRRFVRRIGGARGDHSARLAVGAIRGVALGVVVTALVQASLAALGLFAVGVPFASVLTAFTFILCIAQIGPLPVMAFAVVWTYWTGFTGWGTALLFWSVFVIVIDNVLRPVLIKKGANLPLLLVFLGVIGGLLAFGIIGIFIGPVVLAVGYSLLADWVNTSPPSPPTAPSTRPRERDLAPVR